MSSVYTVSKELVFGTFEHYDWVQLGEPVNHPEKGKEIDLGEDVRKVSGVKIFSKNNPLDWIW